MGRRHSAAILLSVLGLLLSGCGDDTVSTGERTQESYEGPLRVARGEAEHPGAGAAGNVVECAAWGDGGSTNGQEYAEGATAASAEEALEVASSEGAFGGMQRGLFVGGRERDRVLYVWTVDGAVDGAVKQAVIVHNGPATEGAGGPGWYVESWAHCDYSELPRSFTDALGLQIWTDADGRPLPTTTIESWEGPEHCDWQSMTFLHLGGAVYVRNPQPDLADFFATPYEEDADLPAHAVDTGYERNGDRLWLSTDRQRAFVGNEQGVEVWPRTIDPLGCA
jgi:hypothetical protein